ncbi:MAG: hypothetical protein AB7I79_18835 [Rhizobiaceae bacterium]|jgi:hypothetical protein|nr:hypothetical protein [Rhizobiaceae bacterium]
MNEYRVGIESSLEPVALEFFATFSRFEFALKRGGYALGAVGGRASPNWIKFASDLGNDFFSRMRDAEAAKIFFEAPPKRLTVKPDGGVEFTEQAALANTQMLLEAVGLVRNNLFHGEKAWIGERDDRLLRASLFVLDSAFNATQQRDDMRAVCDAFHHAKINPH